MSAEARTQNPSTMPSAEPALQGQALWLHQVRSILRIEARRTFLGRRALLLYLLAGAPVMVMLFFSLAPIPERPLRPDGVTEIFASVFYFFTLQLVLFFSCVWVFTNLFRGEVLERSLHYYLLAPVRRPILVAGKYLAGFLGASTLFLLSTAAAYFAIYLPYGFTAAKLHLLNGPGLSHLIGYLGMTLLAVIGYGAVFLYLGLRFRNPIVPAGLVLVWEMINFLLPPILKKISVIHYVKSLAPVAVDDGPFAIVADPPSVLVSTLGLLVLAGVVLVLASHRIRTMEVDYGSD